MKYKYHSFNQSDNWCTPKSLFDYYNNIYHFDLDSASSDYNHLCDYYFTEYNSGLDNEWFGNVWCNPPYSNIYPFVKKAAEYRGLTVLLLPSRTGSKWFHDLVLPFASNIIFIKGRLKFSESKQNAPFDSMIVIFDNLA